MGKKKKRKVRTLALCVFRRGDKIFVAEGYDPQKAQTFYRPIGGGIEFGEYAVDTLKREVMEEIEQEIDNLRYLSTLENIFVYDGKPGHEIVMIFDGDFVNPEMNRDDIEIEGRDDIDGGEVEVLFTATWKTLDFFRQAGAPPLYPDGLMELLEADDAPTD